MLAQCPRCGGPRQGDRAFCQTCGFDYRVAQAPESPASQAQSPFSQPAAQPSQPPQYQQPAYAAPMPPAMPVAPTTCPRCQAALYPGYPLCSNCGLDLRTQYGAPAAAAFGAQAVPAAAARKSSMPTLLAVGGIALLIAAAGYVYVNQQQKPGASATPRSSGVAVASPSPTATDTVEPTAADVTPTPAKTKAPKTQAPATKGTTPAGTWTVFTPPDGTWSAKFPGTAAPLSSQTTTGTGASQMNITFYYALDPTETTGYFVFTMDAGAALTSMGTDTFLTLMADNMSTAIAGSKGTVVSTTDSTLAGHPAKTFKISASGQDITMALSAVGTRVYMVMTSGAPGTTVYNDYFFNSFQLS